MAWQTARNMDRLRADARAVWPGITIYDIGDLAHARGRSGHNPDDMVLPEGGTAELSDPDGKQEVRALDFMLGPHFADADARALVAALRDPRSRRRLYYVIYDRRIYRRDGSDSPYGGSNPHTDHVHASGWWEDDDDTAPWAAVLEIGEDDVTLDELRGELARLAQVLTYAPNSAFNTTAHPWLADAVTLPKLAAELRLSHAALLAAVQGADGAAILARIEELAAAEAARDAALPAELADRLTGPIEAAVREALAGVSGMSAEQIEAAVANVVGRVRIELDTAPQQ